MLQGATFCPRRKLASLEEAQAIQVEETAEPQQTEVENDVEHLDSVVTMDWLDGAHFLISVAPVRSSRQTSTLFRGRTDISDGSHSLCSGNLEPDFLVRTTSTSHSAIIASIIHVSASHLTVGYCPALARGRIRCTRAATNRVVPSVCILHANSTSRQNAASLRTTPAC